MSYSEELSKKDPEKFFLVKFYGTIIPKNWVQVSGDLWKCLISYLPVSVSVGATTVSTTENILGYYVKDGYLFVDISGIYAGYDPNEMNSVGGANIYVECAFFVTRGASRVFPATPTEDGTDVMWENRILNNVTFGVSQGNSIFGIMTSNSSTLELDNTDGYFADAIDILASMYKRKVEVFHVVNGFVKKKSEGYIRSVGGNKVKITLDMFDFTDVFNQTYYTRGNDHDSRGIGLFAVDLTWSVRPSDVTKPIRRLFGGAAPYRCKPLQVSGNVIGHQVDPSSLAEAINVSYYPGASTTLNRKWFMCLVKNEDIINSVKYSSLQVSAWTNNTYNGANVSRFDFSSLAANDLHPGDCFEVSKNGTKCRFICTDIDQTTGQAICIPQTAIPAGGVIDYARRPYVSILVINQNDIDYQLMWSRDYTFSISADGFVVVTLVNNFEANFSGMGALDAESVMKFRFWSPGDGQSNYAITAIEESLDDVGLVANSASFFKAKGENDSFASFYHPDIDQNDFPTLREFQEKILESICGFMCLEDDFSVGLKFIYDYKYTSNPTAISVKDGEELANSYGFNLSYEDSVNQLITFNKWCQGCSYWTKNTMTVNSYSSQVLHGRILPRTVENLLSPFRGTSLAGDSTQGQDSRSYRREPWVRFFRFISKAVRTASLDSNHRLYETGIGDKLETEGKLSVAGSGQKVVGVNHTEDGVSLDLMIVEQDPLPVATIYPSITIYEDAET